MYAAFYSIYYRVKLMNEFIKSRLKHKVATSLVVLTVRKIIFQVIITASNIILARLLIPEEFGVFAIINFLTISFGFLITFGLGPALVQKKNKVTTKELRAVFTLLNGATLLFIGFVYLAAPVFADFYQGKLGINGVLWLRLFSFTILIDNLAAIPIQLLSRTLQFKKRSQGEIITLVVTQVAIVFLAIKGLGVGAFVIGILIGKLVQFGVFMYLSPWSMGVSFAIKDIKKLLSFGLDYQANSIISSFNNAAVPGFVGVVSGSLAVGLVSWAGGIRQAALAPTDVVETLLFSVASRVQSNKKLLKLLIEKMIRLSCMTTFPLLALVFGLAPQIINIIFTDKWLPGLFTLYLSLIHGIFLLFGVLINDVLLALGEARSVRNIQIFWMILQWVLTIPLVLLWNFNGVVLASLIVSVTFFIPLRWLKRKVDLDVWHNSIQYLLLAAITTVVTFLLGYIILVDSVIKLIFIGSIGMGFYFLLILIFQGDTIRSDIKYFKTII